MARHVHLVLPPILHFAITSLFFFFFERCSLLQHEESSVLTEPRKSTASFLSARGRGLGRRGLSLVGSTSCAGAVVMSTCSTFVQYIYVVKLNQSSATYHSS